MLTGIKKRRLFKNEQEFLDFTRSYLSEEFPNPERRACPPDYLLRALASRPAQTDSVLANHLTCCSPCLTAYLAHLQNAKSKQIPSPGLPQLTYRPALIIVAGTLALISILALVVVRHFQRAHPVTVVNRAPAPAVSPATYVPLMLDLSNGSPVRGTGQAHDSKVATVLLQNSLVDLTLQLPLGSERERYTAQLRSQGSVAWMGSAESQLENGQSLLHIHADFRQIPTGKYDFVVFSKTAKLTLPVVFKATSSGD